MIIGLSGFAGCGKDTVAEYLINTYGYKQVAFASAVKDTLSTVFNWNREMLEGKTAESRKWRDTVDEWWSSNLGIPNFTPRYAMQNIATDIFRNHFHSDIWILSLISKIKDSTDNIVISDARFPNEIAAIKNIGGKIYRVKRGEDPKWLQHAIVLNYSNETNPMWNIAVECMRKVNLHPSEYSWAGTEFDGVINNCGSIADLYQTAKSICK